MPTQRFDTRHKFDHRGLERLQPSVTTNTNICTDLATPSKVIAYQVIDRQSEWAETADSITINANICTDTETTATPMVIA